MHYKLTTILNNVLQNVFKSKDVSNIINEFTIYKFANLLYIVNLTRYECFILYKYNSDELISLHSINKIYKYIYLSNNPKEIHTEIYSYIYNSYNNYTKVYFSDKIDNKGCIMLCKKIRNNFIKYIYKTDTEIYAFIIKYKINNLIYKKNTKNLVNKQQLVLLNKLFNHYNFAYSYNIFNLYN
jgi:hypothetical protein